MTDASAPAADKADDAGEKPTAYEALLRRARQKVEKDKPLLDALLSSSARSSNAG